MTLHQFLYSPSFKKKQIHIYVMTICQDMEKIKKFLQSHLEIQKLPKTIMENKKNDFQRTYYLNDYEILFLNNAKKCSNHELYQLFGQLGANMQEHNHQNIFIYLNNKDKNIIRNQVISYILGKYRFQEYKTNVKKSSLKSNSNQKEEYKGITYFFHKNKQYKEIIQDAIYEAIVQNEIRSLTNTPSNLLTSSSFKKYIVSQLQYEKNNHLKISILNEKELKKIGMNLILAVNQGSQYPAYCVKMEYKNLPKKDNKSSSQQPIVFIGKGVMFDTGGYSIKGGDFSDMKNDMNGSAVVYGLMKLICHQKVKGHFVGLCPLVENMIDAKATRPGDVITCYNKKTVEIVDTDAEGRLIMADCLAYSEKYKPSVVFDIATLTGDTAYMFGGKSSLVIGNNNELVQKIIQCGKENNEKIWELPLWQEYIDLTQSNIADYKNYSYDAQAGAIMAGAFLSNFIPEKCKWIHLDIAGVDNLSQDSNTRSSGSSGEILRTLFTYVKKIEHK